MIMINSCIYVIFRWNSFRVKQKILEIHENCGPRKKAPYGIMDFPYLPCHIKQIAFSAS